LDQWKDEEDKKYDRKSRVPFESKDEMVAYLDEQARSLSSTAVSIKSLVLDCALPGVSPKI
jgi:hypothetical protein